MKDMHLHREEIATESSLKAKSLSKTCSDQESEVTGRYTQSEKFPTLRRFHKMFSSQINKMHLKREIFETDSQDFYICKMFLQNEC